ncbi:KEOPS complex subunit Cgi121 [Halobaculum sp. CBA1158]|uniref:KEOPS complex subunit Cgi121 n=1 Tax=Halobaculum sp. CBA1158 TaxID=2904243 RepID=UPI001F299E66|nr:KEOPS complex subunit Cgi121 [Halobaculum sp. CBA1158]UIO99771.1 KEOPS complex subunit Cgi121 [Halobaculum sp. CBA1158]
MRLVEGTARIDDLDDFLGELTAIGAATDCTVQAFDARYVVDRAHLERALERADRAIARGENVARDRGVEVMLYAAGRRQIDRALAMGVEEGEGPVVVLVAADPETETATGTGAGRDDEGERERAAADRVRDLLDPGEALGEYDEAVVRDYFDVTDAELAATAGTLADVIHERVALLDVRK